MLTFYCAPIFAPEPVAAPIYYEVTGIASGSLGSATFTNNAFTLIGTGDTTAAFVVDVGIMATPLESLSVKLSGFDTTFAVNPVYFFSNQIASMAGFIDAMVGDVLDIGAPTLAAYDGTSYFASVAVSPSFFAPYLTNVGYLSFTDASGLTLSAQGSLVSIPEPSSLALLILGIAGLIQLRVFRAR